MSIGRLAGKTALITGGLGSLGRAQASLYVREGAAVVIVDRPQLERAGKSFAQELSDESRFIGLDIGNLDEAEADIRAASEETGFDILVNNAALIINRPHAEFSLSEYEDQIRVNSSAVFALTRAVAPAMKAKGYGKVINFCSLVLNGRWDGFVPYVASKGAVLGLTKSMARELGPHGIRVNAIAPGAVVSEAERDVFGDKLQEYNDWIIENQSLKHRIQPEHVAALSLFLASPESDMITGQNIPLDGGW